VWNTVTYEYMVIMFGLWPSARVFTKVTKTIILFLRATFTLLKMGYIDDFLIQAKDLATCILHAEIAVLVF
jgi:hypothetical protein